MNVKYKWHSMIINATIVCRSPIRNDRYMIRVENDRLPISGQLLWVWRKNLVFNSRCPMETA